MYKKQVVTDAGLAVFKDCKDLAEVDVAYATQVTDAGVSCFKNCKQLRYLNLGGTQVTDAGLAHFKDCKDLDFLVLDGTQVTDKGLAHFKDCKSVTWLQLADMPHVTDAGLAVFKDCKDLKRLRLGQTPVTDAGLAFLAGRDQLIELTLGKTQVTRKGIEELAKKLPKCKIEWAGLAIETRVGFDPSSDKDVKRIAALPAAEQVEEVRKELKRRNPDFDGTLTPTIEDDVVTGLAFSTEQVSDVSPVRALTKLKNLKCALGC